MFDENERIQDFFNRWGWVLYVGVLRMIDHGFCDIHRTRGGICFMSLNAWNQEASCGVQYSMISSKYMYDSSFPIEDPVLLVGWTEASISFNALAIPPAELLYHPDVHQYHYRFINFVLDQRFC